MPTSPLVFLKLGGSLISDKKAPHTARPDVLARLAAEIYAAFQEMPASRLIIGHGSGSFGHVPARKYDTRAGVRSQADWLGFAEVWREARALNQMVVEALANAGLPVIAMPPSALVTAAHGKVAQWDLELLERALAAGLVPLINGDTIFDSALGGTILSTEELFEYLARQFHPDRILLAGIEEGVWADFPTCQELITRITPANYEQVAGRLGGSAAVDVTGGMLSKVKTMLTLVEELPGLEIRIFSGDLPGQTRAILGGAAGGTWIGATELPGLD
jgi:isopentenyl phosphate kinase